MRLLWTAALVLAALGAQAGAALTSLHSFAVFPNGANPTAAPVHGSDGNFYGTTPFGGTNNYGTVFKINTNGAFTDLYSFTGRDGAFPNGLVEGSDGNFYGTTYGGGTKGLGTVFKISPKGALTSLHSFTGVEDGDRPNGLVQGSDGNFYGTTSGGGTNYLGTVFQISTNGALTSLYTFTGGNDGGYPRAGLVQGSDGNLYGTTGGGTNGNGTVFQISTNAALTSLYTFIGGDDGDGPNGLVQGTDGNFYGTASGGGQGGAGTVFRLTIPPEFQAVALTSSTLSLTWSTEAGGTYQLQYNSDLSSSNWTKLGSAATATGATLKATDCATNGPRRFYRVVHSP